MGGAVIVQCTPAESRRLAQCLAHTKCFCSVNEGWAESMSGGLRPRGLWESESLHWNGAFLFAEPLPTTAMILTGKEHGQSTCITSTLCWAPAVSINHGIHSIRCVSAVCQALYIH